MIQICRGIENAQVGEVEILWFLSSVLREKNSEDVGFGDDEPWKLPVYPQLPSPTKQSTKKVVPSTTAKTASTS
jgi:hypothetical protein